MSKKENKSRKVKRKVKKIKTKHIVKKSKVKKIKLNQNKLKSLSQLNGVEDIYYISTIVHLNELDKYINHLKSNLKSVKKSHLEDSIIKLIKKYKEPIKFVKELNEEVVRKLKDEYDKLYSEMSEKRKKGIDTLMSELELMSIPFKIRLFSSTLDKKDYFKVKNKINKVKKILDIKL